MLTSEPCEWCPAKGTIRITHSGVFLGYGCYICTNKFMIMMAKEEAELSGKPQALAGYMKWRTHVGQPCTPTVAKAILGFE